MKIKLILLFLFVNIICIEQTIAQKLTLTDLTAICNKKNWEDVDKYLFARGWTYFSSSKGDSEHYNTVTWSYNLNSYNDKAEAWFYLYNYDDFPNKIEYNVFNKPAYSLIYNNISSNGFKSVESNIDDDLVTTKYANATYYLEIYNQKRSDDDSYYSSSSITAYGIRLVKKSGVYDPDNGKKTTYHDNYNVKEEYTLKNGEYHGEYKSYFENGDLEVKGTFLNGKANGKFIVYNSFGEKISEVEMKNGLKNGKAITYLNNKINDVSIYDEDLRNGEYSKYYYNDDGRLYLKTIGFYKDDQKSGKWQSVVLTDFNTEEIVAEFNYNNGVLDGLYKEYSNDTLKIGNYSYGKLNGNYLEYYNLNRQMNGGYPTSDTSKLELLTKGIYYNGYKTSNWVNHYQSGAILGHGKYQNDKREGEWKFYYDNYIQKGEVTNYSGQLYLIENYKNGDLDGKTIRYSTLKYTDPYPCGNDSCMDLIQKKVTEIYNYKNGKMNGKCEKKDTLGKILLEGYYLDDVENGDWTYFIYEQNKLISTYKGNFTNGYENGTWTAMNSENIVILTREYRSGRLDGFVNKYDEFGKLIYQKKYHKDVLVMWEDFIPTNDYISIKSKFLLTYDKAFTFELTTSYPNGYSIEEFRISSNDPSLKLNLESFLLDPTKYIKERHGKFEIYVGDKIEISGKYIDDKRVDDWMHYSFDQNVQIRQNYYNDMKNGAEKYETLDETLFSGTYTFTNTTANEVEKIKVKDGLRNGKTIFYDLATNNKLRKVNYKNGIID